jgi:hypothetical protein
MTPASTTIDTAVTTTATIVFERRRPGLERVVQPGRVAGFAAARGPVLITGSE